MTAGGRRFTDFCETFLVHSKGRWAGQPLVLEPFQKTIVSELLRTNRAGIRRYREALIGLARKNGKSTFASALALYLLVADDEPGAEVYAAAASRDQARIVFGGAREMVLASPRLEDWCRVGRDAITVPSTGSVFRVLSSDAPLQHGLNPHGIVVDELHAHRDGGDLYYALRTGQIAREQPLCVAITTAGSDLDSIAGRLYEQGVAGDRPDFYFHWLAVADDEIDDPTAWKAANPAGWVSAADLAREARALPRFAFDRWHLNRWTSAEEGWLPAGAWDACEGELALEDGDAVVVGVDVGQKKDTSAIVTCGKKDGKLVVQAKIMAVAADLDRPPPAHVIVPGDSVELSLLEQEIRELARRYQVTAVAYDPWRFQRSAEILEDEGMMMLEFPQTNARMAPASQGLFDAIVEGRIVHDGDRALKAHIAQAVARDSDRGWRLSKRHASKPMDGAVALALAVAVVDAPQEPEDAMPLIAFV